MILDAAELPFGRPERRRAPPRLLIARAPARDAAGLRLQSGHHTLDQVRRLETHAKRREHVEAVGG